MSGNRRPIGPAGLTGCCLSPRAVGVRPDSWTMGVIPDQIVQAGEELRRIGEQVALPAAPSFAPGTLSAELTGVQNQKATAAAEFARAKDDGLVAAGAGLIHFGTNVTEFDSQGAAGIQRLFPDQAPGPAGGPR